MGTPIIDEGRGLTLTLSYHDRQLKSFMAVLDSRVYSFAPGTFELTSDGAVRITKFPPLLPKALRGEITEEVNALLPSPIFAGVAVELSCASTN